MCLVGLLLSLYKYCSDFPARVCATHERECVLVWSEYAVETSGWHLGHVVSLPKYTQRLNILLRVLYMIYIESSYNNYNKELDIQFIGHTNLIYLLKYWT